MKFVSRMSNLRIVLRPGIPASPITGTPAVPTLFVQFRDGMANVENKELIELMEQHRDFGHGFIRVDENEVDPYKGERYDEGGPVHIRQEIENGRVVSRSKPAVGPNPEMQKAIETQAKALAMAMLPELLKEVQNKASGASEIPNPTPEPDVPEPVVEEKNTEKPTSKNKAKTKKATEK